MLAHLNCVEYWCESMSWMTGTEVVKSGDEVFINAAIDFAGCNVAFSRQEAGAGGAAELISHAKEFYSKRKPIFSLYLRSLEDSEAVRQCQEKKRFMISANPGMVLDQPVRKNPLPDGAELRWIEDAAGMDNFKQVVAEGFLDLGLPLAIADKYFAEPSRVLNPYSLFAVLYYKDQPASAAMAMFSHGIAGIYWVATVKKARGLGLASFCVQEVGNAAFDLGARKVILQASQFGEPVYRKLGYREISRYNWFVCSSKQAPK